MQTNKRMLIIGSGPSTKELIDRGLQNLPADIDTFGMGAQYRFYRRVNWWPTYYALADAKVVFSHRSELAKVIQDTSVTTERFFLSWPVSDHPRLKLINHASTGDLCLRKSVEMGYSDIYLIGIEGQYVEEITQSRPLSKEEYLELGFGQLNLPEQLMRTMRVITETPDENPNYFFNEYQCEGDVYTLPHSHAHRARFGGAADFALTRGAQVTNLSRESRIQDFARSALSSLFDNPYASEADASDPPRSTPATQVPCWYGPFDRREAKRIEESRVLLELFESGAIPRSENAPVMVDVGACHGGAFGPFADRQWIVHAFEPHPRLFEELCLTFYLPTVALNNLAAGDESKQGLTFFTSGQSAEISSLVPFHETHEDSLQVDSIRLDEYLERENVDHIDFLKIDTEGSGLNVLKGLDITRHPPEVVLCEYEDRKTTTLGYDFHDLADYLQAAGFAVYLSEWYPVVRYGGRQQWRVLRKYPCELDNPDSRGNLLAFRTDPGMHTLSRAVRDDVMRFDDLDTRARVGKLERELEELHTSRSWRLTAPLRKLLSRAKKTRSPGR